MSESTFSPKVIRVAVLMLLMVLGAFAASDMYLPAFPAIKQAFSVSSAQVQFTMSVYFFGSMCCLLFAGPVSDRFGRKKVILTGLSVMVVGLAFSCFAKSYESFLVSRIIQGFAAGAIFSGMRTVFKDMLKGERLILVISYLGVVVAFGPALAPVIGGVITSIYGWRVVFVLCACFFFVLFLVAAFKFPETLSKKSQIKNRKESLIAHVCAVIRCFPFICYSLAIAVLFGGYMAYLTASPVIVQTHLHYTPSQYGGLMLVVLLLGQLSKVYNVFYLTKKGSKFMIHFGISLICIGAGLLVFAASMHYYSLLWFFMPMFFVQNGISIILPNIMGRTLNMFSNIVGVASAIYSVIQMLGIALGAALMSVLSESTLLPLSWVILIAVTLSAFLLIIGLRYDKSSE